jgi:hypothetical protein
MWSLNQRGDDFEGRAISAENKRLVVGLQDLASFSAYRPCMSRQQCGDARGRLLQLYRIWLSVQSRSVIQSNYCSPAVYSLR